ncbi:hypothetical protein BDR05DRAFT_1005894 [Suillus weaverae]|nr:hypothetical protein BDR05DRAFT_1005894 [Suillus weaverae]
MSHRPAPILPGLDLAKCCSVRLDSLHKWDGGATLGHWGYHPHLRNSRLNNLLAQKISSSTEIVHIFREVHLGSSAIKHSRIRDQFDTILMLDFGSQVRDMPCSSSNCIDHECCFRTATRLIAWRYRELNACAELTPRTSKLADLKFKPKGSLMRCSGKRISDASITRTPVSALSASLFLTFGQPGNSVDALFDGLGDQMQVWMSHGDQLPAKPPDFHPIGWTITAPYAAIAHNSKSFHGIPEGEFIGKEIVRIREICGPKGCVIGAVSGDVDSTVAAKLMHEAIGNRFHAIMVDNGVLRLNEAQQVNDVLNKDLGVNLTVVDASELFLSRLDGVEDPYAMVPLAPPASTHPRTPVKYALRQTGKRLLEPCLALGFVPVDACLAEICGSSANLACFPCYTIFVFAIQRRVAIFFIQFMTFGSVGGIIL